jgi:hypothetical protein
MNQLQTYSNPTYGVLLPNPVMFSWLGTNEAQTRFLRDSGTVAEGTDYVRHSPHANLPKERQPIFWTLAGLYKLCGLLGTPQAQQFRTMLDQFVQAPGALVPATPQTLTPPMFEQYQEYQEPTYYPAPYSPSPIATHPTQTPAQTLAHQQAAQMVANALAPQITASIQAVNNRQQREQVDLVQRQQQLDLEAFQTHTAVILAAQKQAVEGVRDVVSNLPVSDFYMETRPAQTWFDKLNQDPLALALVGIALVAGTGLITFLMFSALRPNPTYAPTYQPSIQRSY